MNEQNRSAQQHNKNTHSNFSSNKSSAQSPRSNGHTINQNQVAQKKSNARNPRMPQINEGSFIGDQQLRDIHEENHADTNEVQRKENQAKPYSSEMIDSFPLTITKSPDQLTIIEQRSVFENGQRKKHIFIAYSLIIVSTLMFTFGFLCIGYSNHQVYPNSHQSSQYYSYSLPFYSLKFVCSAAMFGVVLLFILLKNLKEYCEFGILSHNEFYCQQKKQIKSMELLLTLGLGLIFSVMLTLYFKGWELSQIENQNCAMNTTFILLIPSILTCLNFLSQSDLSKGYPVIGGFLTLCGLVYLYISLPSSLTSLYIFGLQVPTNTIFYFTQLICAVIMGLIVNQILKMQRRSNVSYNGQICLIMVVDGLYSVICGSLLLTLNKFVSRVPSQMDNSSSLTILQSKILMSSFGGLFIAVSIIVVTSVANEKANKILALIFLTPLIHYLFEALSESIIPIDVQQLIAIILLTLGSIMIILNSGLDVNEVTEKKEDIKKQIKDPLLKDDPETCSGKSDSTKQKAK